MICRALLPAAAVALLLSCDAKPAPPAAALAKKSEIHIQIKVQGNGFASRAELDERNGLEDEIEKRKIGEVVDAGSGGGSMDLVVEVSDPVAAKNQILRLLAERKLIERATVSVSADK